MDIGKLLIGAAAAYFGYEYFLGPKSTTVSTAAGGVIPGPTPPVNPVVNQATTQSLVLAAANAAGFKGPGTVDQWDWYYGIARGIPAPDPVADWGMTDANRGELMTFDEWWKLATSHGLSGMGGGYIRGRF